MHVQFDRESLNDLGLAESMNVITIVLRCRLGCCAMDSSGLGYDQMAGSCERSNDVSACMKCGLLLREELVSL